MPDDHSKLAPLLPIPNRTVKRLCADDSAGSRVKVGHRQALTASKQPPSAMRGAFLRLEKGFKIWGTVKNEQIHYKKTEFWYGAGAFIHLVNIETNIENARFDLSEDYSVETAMILVKFIMMQ